jgi:hypothetical protein
MNFEKEKRWIVLGQNAAQGHSFMAGSAPYVASRKATRAWLSWCSPTAKVAQAGLGAWAWCERTGHRSWRSHRWLLGRLDAEVVADWASMRWEYIARQGEGDSGLPDKRGVDGAGIYFGAAAFIGGEPWAVVIGYG